MADRLRHRGPDDGGVWSDPDAGLALSHRRLSILDLSPAGHQPMASASARYVLVYNGEIYNHQDIRGRLEAQGRAPAWRGHSDTETLLAAIEAWGMRGALEASAGMFALALWDREQRCLTLARDRLGEKPLYYGWQGKVLLFGSELKALTSHPSFDGEIDRGSLALLLRHNYIPAPYSIWKGIAKLPAGTFATFRQGQQRPEPQAYWSLAAVAERGQRAPFRGDAGEAQRALEHRLSVAVKGQMLSDVPLGALLSGGIDSSTVVALMQSQSSRRVKTFSIGFHEAAFDESAHAREVAAHLGTDHTELKLCGADMLTAVPRLPVLYDEPFADSSQLPTAVVVSLARQHVTVALSGDGGDELLGGYNRYLVAARTWELLRRVPRPVRAALGRALVSVPASAWDRALSGLARRVRQAHVGEKAHKLGSRMVEVRSLDELYLALVTEWPKPEEAVLFSEPRPTLLSQRERWPALEDGVARMMALDALTYLPDDIMVKVDRAAMGVSLETRAPFLDHRAVELAWSLPMTLKISGGVGKWLLRQILYRYVPPALVERPKVGFGIPLQEWLRGPLRGWAEDLLAPATLKRQGYLEAEAVQKAWRQHVEGGRSLGSRLWSVLMFQAWLAEQAGNR